MLEVQCEKCDCILSFDPKNEGKPGQCDKCGHVLWLKPNLPDTAALKLEAKGLGGGVNTEWDQNKTELAVLREIRDYTKKTAFWTRVTGIPVLIGMIIGFLMGLEKCS